MDRQRAQTIGEWLRANRGLEPQDKLLARMKAVTGWAPSRPNYSKYENGRTDPTPETLQKFVDFWASQGKAGPDFTPPPPEPTFEERMLTAIERQTAAINALVGQLARLTTEQASGQAALMQALGAMARALDLAGTRNEGAPDVHAGTAR